MWLAFDNKILSLSKNGNETMTIEDGRHVLGLSNHVLDVSNQAWSVFITELGISGPSVYRISGKNNNFRCSCQSIQGIKRMRYFTNHVCALCITIIMTWI